MFIQQTLIKLIIFLSLFSCTESSVFSGYKKAKMQTQSGIDLKVILAINPDQQTKGLSHIKPDQFENDQVMLFTGNKTTLRRFWMPDTFFNLDIVFLSKDFYVIDVHRNVPFYPKKTPQHKIPLSRAVFCTHVLEIKSSSPLAKDIKIGEYLKWKSSKSLSQILQDTH